jgi:hypothetical protein
LENSSRLLLLLELGLREIVMRRNGEEATEEGESGEKRSKETEEDAIAIAAAATQIRPASAH